MAWTNISKMPRRVGEFKNFVRGFRATPDMMLYAEDENGIVGQLDVLTDAVNLAGQTAVTGNEGLGALGLSSAQRGSMLVRGETAYENMPPGSSLQVPHWNSDVARGMEPVTLLPGPWERVTLAHARYQHGDQWVHMPGGANPPIYPFGAGNPRPGLFWRWEGRDIVRVQGGVVDTYYAYGGPPRNNQGTLYTASLPAPGAPMAIHCIPGTTLVSGTTNQAPNFLYTGMVSADGLLYPFYNNDGTPAQGMAIYLNFAYAAASQRP